MGNRYLALPLVAILLVLQSFAAPKINWETARVISQELDAVGGSAVSMPRGTMHAAFPTTRHYNIVVVETDSGRMTWSELGKRPIVLTVDSTIRFYRDGDRFIVLDSSRKKHKFALVGMAMPSKVPVHS